MAAQYSASHWNGSREQCERDEGPGTQREGPHGARRLRGAADYSGTDATLVRVVVVVICVITGGAGILAYLAAWA